MTIQSSEKHMHEERASADAPVASCHGHDVSATLNAQYERIHESEGGGYAPGATSAGVSGHVHNGYLEGRGLQRAKIGEFYTRGRPLTLNYPAFVSAGAWESLAAANSTSYEQRSGSPYSYVIGVAYVSSGIDTIGVWVQVKSSAGNGSVRIKNITDGTTSSSSSFSASGEPEWILLSVAVTNPDTGDVYRVELDVEFTYSSTEVVYLYCAFPYEYLDQT